VPTLRFAVLSLACLTLASSLSAQDQLEVLPPAPGLKLLQRVDPEYPPLALRARIQGIVRFEATIGISGRVEHLRLISGHPLLVLAARQAAKRWRYLPARWNGIAVEVRTLIEIGFWLDEYGNPRNLAESPRDATI